MTSLDRPRLKAARTTQTRQNVDKMEGSKVKKPKLKHSNAEMASSSAVTSPFDSLPDEIVLKIFKMAAWEVGEHWNEDGDISIDEK